MQLSGQLVSARRRLIALLMFSAAFVVSAEPLVYRGKFDYLVPEPMYDKMIELAPIETWEHFPQLTRFVDATEEGGSDFVAIALGARGGYGAQIRYRLKRGEDGAEAELGLWYWCVITDAAGEKVFEQFNP